MIRVLVVEDSASMRQLLVRLLETDDRFAVVGTARDGEEAVAQAQRLRPDVITMDLHLPRLDGVAATLRIMAETPTPIVVVSASTDMKEQGLAFQALQAGAVTVLGKPPGPGHPCHDAAARELLATLRLMSGVKVVRRRTDAQPASRTAPPPTVPERGQAAMARIEVIAIAASTGGPQAIQAVLQGLGPAIGVPVLVVQHMSKGFLDGMAAWLASTCPYPVRLAEPGQLPVHGTVYLAPEDHHLLATRRGRLALSRAPATRGFRPSADILFESLAEAYGARAIGVILTGMGDDGAAGLQALRAAGALTIAQDEATSAVYGMPRAAAMQGAVERVLPLASIGPFLRQRVLPNGQRPDERATRDHGDSA